MKTQCSLAGNDKRLRIEVAMIGEQARRAIPWFLRASIVAPPRLKPWATRLISEWMK